MLISNTIKINAEDLLNEISQRQNAPWNGYISTCRNFPLLQKLFEIINSGIPKEDFFYSGDLFRIHCPYSGYAIDIDEEKEYRASEICRDGSCSIQRYLQFSDQVTSFSKSPDFTSSKWYKVYNTEKSTFIHVNTKELYGIDINVLQARFNIETRFAYEQEVLFPLKKDFIVKEYHCTPNQMKYYFRNGTFPSNS